MTNKSLINSLTTEELKECLTDILEAHPELSSFLVKYTKQDAVSDITEDIDDRIYELIESHMTDGFISESDFDDLTTELCEMKELGARCLAQGDYMNGLNVFLALAQVEETLVSSTTSDCVELDVMLQEIKSLTENVEVEDKKLQALKADILALLRSC